MLLINTNNGITQHRYDKYDYATPWCRGQFYWKLKLYKKAHVILIQKCSVLVRCSQMQMFQRFKLGSHKAWTLRWSKHRTWITGHSTWLSWASGLSSIKWSWIKYWWVFCGCYIECEYTIWHIVSPWKWYSLFGLIFLVTYTMTSIYNSKK